MKFAEGSSKHSADQSRTQTNRAWTGLKMNAHSKNSVSRYQNGTTAWAGAGLRKRRELMENSVVFSVDSGEVQTLVHISLQ